MKLIDTHAHLDMDPFDRDRNGAITRALQAGVSTIVTVGIDLPSSEKAIKLAESHPEIWATVGFHPHEAAWVTRDDMDDITDLARHPRVVAIGETGLDFYRNRSPREAQLKIFKWQLELARKTNLPVIIHSRQADRETMTVLGEWVRSLPASERPVGVIHCFNGDKDTALKYVDMDFYISFGAYIGYPSSAHLQDTIRSLPGDRFVLETDCPFLPPQIYRGKRNEPAYLRITLNILADIRREPPERVAAETTENAHRLFGFLNSPK